MDRQQMLQEIYEKIADKTLSMGCIYEYGGEQFPICIHSINFIENNIGTYKVIGHPISLSRVLSALGHGYWYDFSNQMIMFMKDSFIDGIYWYLLKEDKSDAYLDDQSDETIKAIREIICKCDHVGDGVAYMTNPAQYKCKKCGEMFK